jgi:phage shock protein A
MRDFFVGIIDLVCAALRGSLPPASLSSLDRSIAAAGSAHAAARRSLAVAVSEEKRETGRRESLTAQAADLEARAVEALRAGREDLAQRASEAIAAMRTDIESSERASGRFAAEVALARREVDAQRRRLADLDRGRRLARVGAALRGTTADPAAGTDRFAEAEASLARLQADNADARATREEMSPPAERLIGCMAEEGFGPPVGVRASDVMERLRAMASAPRPVELISTRSGN